SDGPFEIYTEESWQKYYLGWEAINRLRDSDIVKTYPGAFANAYPQLYLVRPSINSYNYANLRSLSILYGLKAEGSGLDSDYSKSKIYLERSQALQQKALEVLWNDEDQFFYTY